MKNINDLKKTMYSTLGKHQYKLLEIEGVDIKRFITQQKETGTKMREIAKDFRNQYLEKASTTEKKHLQAVSAIQASIKSLLAVKDFKPIYLCGFYGFGYYDEVFRYVSSVDLYPLDDENRVKGSAPGDQENNIGRPYLELHGGISEESEELITVRGNVQSQLIFDHSMTNRPSGKYTIKALVQANGYHTFWPRGCGSCSTSPPGTTAHLTIKAKLEVEQGGILVGDDILPILTIPDDASPDSIDVNRYISCSADLEGGHSVVVRVIFEIDGEINGCGDGWIDLQTSQFYYFKVPMIYICHYRPWNLY